MCEGCSLIEGAGLAVSVCADAARQGFERRLSTYSWVLQSSVSRTVELH